ncbi:cell wall-binding repeat-containing protein [Microbacterium sp. Root180]|uniref:cell wall-binding repeat-containing protein n=1 Tax=Microbacterium sp. Root180 TaxID=1736483 RepID=UPI0006FDA558|nr:cell wall-binding repeat-containing protein [Microbacterium sp. Root180]KRB37775.1 hypothetical protein ASD93_05440 [Microbacterium sp. Root180]
MTPAQAATITPGDSTTVAALLDDLRVEAPVSVTYNRDLFFEGQDLDSDGCRTRQEVLLEETLVPATVTGTCTVTTGEWFSYYDGVTHTESTALEMDHLVAMKETWVSGAYAWTEAQRTAYSNETDYPATLVMVTAAVNTAKSDKDPSAWLPPLSSARCQYVTDWVTVKWRWNLAVNSTEKTAIQNVLAGCGTLAVAAPLAPVVGTPADPGTGGETVIAPFPGGTTRLAGASRYETAIQVSQRYAPGVPAVFVATGTNFPDALSAAAAAALVGGPLLLTTPTSLPSVVLQEIQRLAPQNIYVIGGTGAVSDSVKNVLATIAPTERFAGANRYTTGQSIVSSIFPSSSTVFLATGASFPDALAATGAAGARSAPVLLVKGTAGTLDADALASLSNLGATNVVIAGGTGVVSNGIQSQLNNLGYNVSRFGGASRYDTAALINSAFFPSGSSSTMFLATGTNFPDALAGAAMAGRIGAPLYVTTAACTPEGVHNSVASLNASNLIVMGGAAVVSDAAASNTGCLTVGTPSISGNPRVTSTLTANEGNWTNGTSFAYRWYANGTAISGASGKYLAVSAGMAGKKISVKVTGSKTGWLTAAKTSSATAAVGYPSRTAPADSWNCPSWAPIKGNQSSSGEWIYHMPYGQFYDATNPEDCFRTEAAAVAAGYRKSKR